MSNLQSRTKNIRVVINFPLCRSMNEIVDLLSQSGYQFAMIIHDKDTNDEGELKTKHIHLVLLSPKRHQLQYYLYRLSDIFGINENQCSIQVSESTTNDIQYLIHKNDITKYQYNVEDIIHNMNNEYINMELSSVNDTQINIGTLINIVENSNNRIQIMERIGLARYCLYRNVIKDIQEDLWCKRSNKQ